MSDEEAGRLLIVALQACFDLTGTTFKFEGPCQAVVKLRNKEFKTQSFIGDEEFKATACYMGKKGKVIVSFKPVAPQVFAFMELELGKANKLLKGFERFVTEALNSKDDAKVAGIVSKIAVIEANAQRKALAEMSQGDARFGSW